MSFEVKRLQELDVSVIPMLERIHRQLRPNMPQGYETVLKSVFEGEGKVFVALRDGDVVGLAIYRVIPTPRCGLRFYVDDLVVDESLRGGGIGAGLLRALEDGARASGASAVELESGISREATHRFYEREGFERFAISFRKRM